MHNGKICLSCIIYYLHASAGYLHKTTDKIQQTATYMSKTMAYCVSGSPFSHKNVRFHIFKNT